MRLLKTHFQDGLKCLKDKTVTKRLATRAIVLDGRKILLLHTKRYDDYSLPGGGLDKGEDLIEGMKRELKEETGAQLIKNIKPFGVYEEYRFWHKPDFDVQHMISYCYTCEIDSILGKTQYESYELVNGMTPIWMELSMAIRHNEEIIANSPKKGLSVERETFLFKLILSELY